MKPQEKAIFNRPDSMSEKVTHYCPGCTHGIIHRLVAEALDDLGLREKTIGVAPVGCSVLIYNYFNCDFLEAPHGRAPALATGLKRVSPEKIIFTYQGDGDLASIGMSEIVHAANRGEKITVIFVNNAIYGMTGGQMAPTTLPMQKTTTCPRGRETESTGMPIKMVEMLATLGTPSYLERVAVNDPRQILKTKKAIRQAFKYQAEGRCFSLIEILSTCPTGWGETPGNSLDWIETNMKPRFPLGLFKSPEQGATI